MIMLAQLLLSLSILVAVHEMGHLLAAKYFGMRVEQFSIGFPPKIWSFKKGETEYAISAIPLGGYVKISGMIDESLDTEMMKQEPQAWEFRSKPAWQRLIVMLGGIFVNVVVGIMIFIGLTFIYGETYLLNDEVNKNGGIYAGRIGEMIGLKTGDRVVKINGNDFKYFEDVIKPETLLSGGTYTIDRNGEQKEIAIPSNLIEEVGSKESAREFVSFRIESVIAETAPGTLAGLANLQSGDRVIEIDGKPVKYQDEVIEIMSSKKNDDINFKVLRGDKIYFFKGINKKKKKLLGFMAQQPKAFLAAAEHQMTFTFLESIPHGTERAFTTLVTQIKAFGKMISGKLNPQKSLSGPIGIMQVFGAEWDWERFWSLTGVLSLVLAFMNLLPIPALDGGHVMFLSYEMISRRKPSDKFLEVAQKIGMVFLLALMVFIFANDIFKVFLK